MTSTVASPASISATSRFVRVWLLAVLVAVASGCATADRVETHEEWPTEQGAWKLYESDGQLVYATGGRAAEQVGALVRNVATDYRKITGEDPVAVVPVAFASGDDPPLEPFDTRWVELVLETRQLIDALRNADSGTSNAAIITSLEAIAESPALDTDDPDQFRMQEMLDKEVPPESIIAISPIFCRAEQLGLTSTDGTPPTVHPFVASDGRRSDALSAMIEAGMREQGLPWWKRALVAPILPIVRGKLEEKMQEAMRFSLFELQILSREPRFNEDEKKRYLDEYALLIGLREPPDFSEVKAAAKGLESQAEPNAAVGDPAPPEPSP